MKKKVFITGASGTVGKAFIKEYYNKTKSYKKTKDKFNISSSGTLWHIINKSVI